MAGKPIANFISILDAENKQIDKIYASQAYERGIREIIIGTNGWLWIDGDAKDYLTQIDLNNTPPIFGRLIEMPELYEGRYSYFWNWFDKYFFTHANFSKQLNRAFVTGYPLSWFGISLFGWPPSRSYEVVDGIAKLLP
jgi:hypothetical protein